MFNDGSDENQSHESENENTLIEWFEENVKFLKRCGYRCISSNANRNAPQARILNGEINLAKLPDKKFRVRYCAQLAGHNKVTIKVIDCRLQRTSTLIKVLADDLRALALLKFHPNIALPYDYFRRSMNIYLVCENASGQGLIEFLNSMGRTVLLIHDLLSQIASAVSHAHNYGIVHRNLTPSSIRVNEYGKLKIRDFGLSPKLIEPTGQWSDLMYMAPEVIKSRRYEGKQADIYSMGIILYEILHGTVPYLGLKSDVLLKIFLRDITWMDDIPSKVKLLIRKMLHPDPWKRPEAKDCHIPIWPCNFRNISSSLTCKCKPSTPKPCNNLPASADSDSYSSSSMTTNHNQNPLCVTYDSQSCSLSICSQQTPANYGQQKVPCSTRVDTVKENILIESHLVNKLNSKPKSREGKTCEELCSQKDQQTELTKQNTLEDEDQTIDSNEGSTNEAANTHDERNVLSQESEMFMSDEATLSSDLTVPVNFESLSSASRVDKCELSDDCFCSEEMFRYQLDSNGANVTADVSRCPSCSKNVLQKQRPSANRFCQCTPEDKTLPSQTPPYIDCVGFKPKTIAHPIREVRVKTHESNNGYRGSPVPSNLGSMEPSMEPLMEYRPISKRKTTNYLNIDPFYYNIQPTIAEKVSHYLTHVPVPGLVINTPTRDTNDTLPELHKSFTWRPQLPYPTDQEPQKKIRSEGIASKGVYAPRKQVNKRLPNINCRGIGKRTARTFNCDR